MSMWKNPSRRSEHVSHAAALAAAIMVWLGAPAAHAGPPELFSRIVVGSSNPDLLALPYYYGGSGVFLSGDGGMNFSLLCSSAIDATLVREQDVYTTLVSGTGAIHLAGPTGLWSGAQNGCDWTEVAELKGTWISDVVADPVDPKRSYAVTSVAGMQNGIRVNDGVSKEWPAFGSLSAFQLGWLHVAKTSAGKIFYERGVQNTGGMNQYVIRVSEDEAKTWMEHAFGHAEAQDVRILAVDPADPNRIVVSIVSDTDKTVLPNPPDELWFSPMRGAPGSFMKAAQVGVLRGTVFGPDGALYYGDDATDTPGLYTIKKLGDPPMKLSSKPVSCLGYDSTKKRLYGCTGYEFGTFDVASGEFSALFDKRKASQFVECAGLAPASMRCREQATANYCGYGHYWQAPLCEVYMLPGSPFDPKLSAGTAGTGTGGAAPAAAGSSAAPAVAGMAAAGTPVVSPAPLAGASAGVTPPAPSSGGCTCIVGSDEQQPRALWLLALSLLGVAMYRRSSRAHR